MDAFERRLKELLQPLQKEKWDMNRAQLVAYVRQADGFVSKWSERHAEDALWAKIKKACQGESDEDPVLFAVSTKAGYVYRPPERMTWENYGQYIGRGNKTLVRLRDKLALTRDTVVEQFERAIDLFLVGQALDPETAETVRIRPVHKDMLPGLFPDDEGDDDSDE